MGSRIPKVIGWLTFLCASIPPLAGTAHADDVFFACSSDRTQRLRPTSIVTNGPAACHSSETARTWRETGPAGPPGPQGPAGPSDAFATSVEIGDPRAPIAIPSGPATTVATLNLPSGSYVATASLYFTNGSVDSAIAYCMLLIRDGIHDHNAQVIDSEGGGQAVSQALTTAASLPSGGTASLICVNNGPTGNLAIQTYNLTATKVGALSFQ
ncbi:MAG TPA: hypothetical protein VFD92_12895 [Candidatus Binatia bacterium]|nr:hypothetical protein [Candidatus Binatia bacterium]